MMRLRLQMLAPASDRCSWNRRISSVVAVAGDRFRNVANCLQLRMWPLCVPAQSLRAFMSSIMRWRNGVTDSVLIGKLLSWMRLKTPRSSRQGAPPAIDDLYSVTVPQIVSRLSGLSRSDLVQWLSARMKHRSIATEIPPDVLVNRSRCALETPWPPIRPALFRETQE